MRVKRPLDGNNIYNLAEGKAYSKGSQTTPVQEKITGLEDKVTESQTGAREKDRFPEVAEILDRLNEDTKRVGSTGRQRT